MWATLKNVELLWAVAIMFLGTSHALLGCLLILQGSEISKTKELVMGLVDDLNAIKLQLDKAKGEIVSKIADLENAVANAGVEDAGVTNAVTSLKEAAQQLDDLVADPQVPPVAPEVSVPADEGTVTE